MHVLLEVRTRPKAEPTAHVKPRWNLYTIYAGRWRGQEHEIEHPIGRLAIPPEKGAKHPSQATHIYADHMRPKNTSKALKRHRQTFYLARRDPEHWEKERNTVISVSLHEAAERTQNTERELEECKLLLKDSQQRVSCVAIYDNGLSTHKFEG